MSGSVRRDSSAKLPGFNPFVLIDGIRAKLVGHSFQNEEYKNSVQHIFQSVGLAPIMTLNDKGTFVNY